MLAESLNTNQIKNAAGTEKEFFKIGPLGDSGSKYQLIPQDITEPHVMNVRHAIEGTGVGRKRKSVIRFEKSTAGLVDATKQATCWAQVTTSVDIGNLENLDNLKEVLANLMSFLATTGAGTTVLFDCTGTGAVSILEGSY